MVTEDIDAIESTMFVTTAIFLASLPTSLLSYARSTFNDRDPARHRATDDVVNCLWFASVLFALFAAVFRRSNVNAKFSDSILFASFVELTTGIIVFAWAELGKPVAITLTATPVILWLAFIVYKSK